MTKILFVCFANVIRSQIAEAYYNHFTKSKNASSAGVSFTHVSKYKHPIKEAIEVMKEEDIDMSKQEVELLRGDMVEKADKIYVLCDEDHCPYFLSSSGKVKYWNIADPLFTTMKNYRKIRDSIKEKVLEIIRKS